MNKLAVDVMLYVDQSTTEVPDYVAIASQRGASLSMSTESHDITTKKEMGSPLYRDYIMGIKEWSLEVDGLLPFDEESFDKFEEAYMENKKLKVELRTSTKSKYTGFVVIESVDFDFAYDDLAQYSASLLGAGVLEKVVTP